MFEGRTSGQARLKDVIEECRRRLKEEPADTVVVLRLADALASAGQAREAVQVLNRTGSRLQKAGKFVEAVAVYKKVAELDPRAEVTVSFLSQIELKKIQEAAAKVGAAEISAPAATRAIPAGPATSVTAESAAATGTADGEATRAGKAERRKKAEKVHELRQGIPLLKDVPPFLFDLVLEKIRLRTLAPGEALFSEGDAGGSLFFVATGELVGTTKADTGASVRLFSLGPGDVAGVVSFLSEVPRTATVVARTRVDVLELDRNALTSLSKKHRQISDALSRLYAERVLGGVLARSRFFGRLPASDRDAIARRLKPATAKPGEVVIREGATDSGVFLVRRGALRVTVRRGAREVALALLQPHDIFGDVGTMKALPRTASVAAITETELLRLSAPDLHALLAQRPELSAVLEEIQRERFLKNEATLAREP